MNGNGSDNDVPVITGYQAGDSTDFMQPPPNDLDAYQKTVQNRYGDMAAQFEKLYPVTNAEEIKAVWTESNQDRSRVSMFLWARTRLKSHKQPVYTYYFDRAIPWPQHPEFGAFHTGEIPYFFMNLNALDRPWANTDYSLAQNVSSYLLDFAAAGDPSGAGLVPWPQVDASKPRTMELGSRCGPMPLANAPKTEFWTRYYNSPLGNTAPFF